MWIFWKFMKKSVKAYPDGFFIMIEGGRIDHACHDNDIKRATRETVELSNAVQVALDWIAANDPDYSETLLLITADHETGGLTVTKDNGPGQYPSVTWSTTNHTGANVPVYAVGVNAELVSGVMDNTDIWGVVTAMTDTTGPVVSNVSVAFNTPFDNAAAVMWDTDEAADSLVEYGESSGSYTGQAASSEMVTEHSLVVSNLKPDRDYYFTITSADAGGNVTTTVEYVVTTSWGNHIPEAQPMSVGVVENGSAAFTLSAIDDDGDELTFSIVSGPGHGSLDVTNLPAVVYTPEADFHGTDSFEFKAADATSWDTATVNINVTARVQAVDDSAWVDEDEEVVIYVLANDVWPSSSTMIVESVTPAAHGTLTINEGETVTYIPDADWNGTDTFTYTVLVDDPDLPQGNRDTATVTVTVNPVNDAPVANDDENVATTNEDTAVSISAAALIANDMDIDGDTLTVTAVGNAFNGTADLADGIVTFTPAPDFWGTGGFEYLVDDGHGGTDTATATITVVVVNDAPVAVEDSLTTDEDTPVSVSTSFLLANDSDVDGDELSVTDVGNAVNGSVVMNGETVTFTPAPNFNGAASFRYTISDGNGGMATATVSVSVAAVNDAPVAVGDSATTDELTAIMIDVLANDTDVDTGDVLTIESVTSPTYGSAAIVDGKIEYIPNGTPDVVDSFDYTIMDSGGATATATVSVTITAFNTAPVAEDDTAVTDEDTAVTIDVLANDFDKEGGDLSVLIMSTPSSGGVSVEADNKVTYTPAPDFNGTDSFTYQASDGDKVSNVATVTVTVTPVNDAPVAVDDIVTTDEDTPVEIAGSFLTSNDTDVDGDVLWIAGVDGAVNGAVVLDGGNVTFTPDPDFNGTGSFNYTVTDGNGGTDTGTVTVTIRAVNDAPVAESNAAVTDEDTPVAITLIATDVDSGTLTYSIVSGPSKGTLSGTAPNLTYQPAPDVHGLDTFTFKANDGDLDSNEAVIAISIKEINDNPVAVGDSASTTQDIPVDIWIADLLANDTDVDGDIIAFAGLGEAVNGTVSDNGDGTVTFAPEAGFHGTGGFEYDIIDGRGGSATGTVTITVVQSAPLYTPYYAIAESTSQGVVVGDMSLTADGVQDTYQVITEAESGNKNFTWYLLSHEWQFDILESGDTVLFCVEAYQIGNEGYVFSYSVDGITYTDMLTVTKTADDDRLQEYALPAGLTGTVYVRVVDMYTDKNETGPADSILIDELSIRCTASVPQASNPVPASGSINIDPDIVLSWTPGAGAVYHDVYFGTDPMNLQPVSVQQTAATYDPSPVGSLVEGVTYYWAVDEFDETGALVAAGALWSFQTGTGCTPTTAHVESIVLSTVDAGKGTKRGMATVTIYDNCGTPVEGAEVTGHFEGDFSDSGTVATDSSGQAVFVTSVEGAVRKPVFNFVVDNVVSSLDYDPSGGTNAQMLMGE